MIEIILKKERKQTVYCELSKKKKIDSFYIIENNAIILQVCNSKTQML